MQQIPYVSGRDPRFLKSIKSTKGTKGTKSHYIIPLVLIVLFIHLVPLYFISLLNDSRNSFSPRLTRRKELLDIF